ncbi:hypothetical protein DFR52_1076 [Hoeflea marina]|uniref:tRNA synthetase class II (G, H, P, S and T) n=1 Tax=Hoeflea marina TaxID=274592 RepID=A0A317PGR1_9HYPH|nr:hypothetical protein [Hoeflea marina]PWV97095.1 hypothetical protein DFR52_1076 [Hoeflea marina]
MIGQHSFCVTPAQEALFDSELSKLACFRNATAVRLSPLLSEEFVLAANYMKSFPQHAFRVTNGLHEDSGYLLSPTCCYPVFSHLSGQTVTQGRIFTHKNQCYRREDYIRIGERQSAFLMREYIAFNPDLELIRAWIDDVKLRVSGLLERFGLAPSLDVASDPFFNPDDYKHKIQKAERLKTEFVIDGLAIGSVNLHLRSFTNACSIRDPQGQPPHSACFGLGYDRLAHVLNKHGSGEVALGEEAGREADA